MPDRHSVEAQFERFFEQEFTAVVNGVAFVIGDPELAKDLVTEAVGKAWIRARKGEEIESLAAWTRTVAINAARSTHRRRGREERAVAQLETPAPLPPVEAGVPPIAETAHEALSKLSQRQRQVVVMRYYHQLSIAEIATELRIAEATVRTFLRRGRAVLTGVLSGDLSRLATVIPIERARDAG